jgi:hypothetical protein
MDCGRRDRSAVNVSPGAARGWGGRFHYTRIWPGRQFGRSGGNGNEQHQQHSLSEWGHVLGHRPDLSLDDTDFFSNAPFSLDPSQSSGPFDIFTIDIGALATPGVISPNFFSILGGSDGGASDVIGTVMFDVTVQGTAPVPEPSELLLLLFGIAQIGVWGASLRAGQKK